MLFVSTAGGRNSFQTLNLASNKSNNSQIFWHRLKNIRKNESTISKQKLHPQKKHKTIKKKQLPYNKKSKNITSLEKKFIQEQT